MSDHPTSPAATSTTSPTTPASAIRVARIGGTAAELAAAAISAHTLYHLGGQLDLGPWAAWLLPAALDVYAFTALAVAYSLPIQHPAQKPVLRTARLAFTMTLGANALDHFLTKAGRLVDPTIRDLLLVAVATLPPLVVERLLNLQSLLAGDRTTVADHEAETRPEHLSAGRPVGQAALVHNRTGRAFLPTRQLDRFALGSEVFAELAVQLGRRPSGREFQAAMAERTRTLVAAGILPADTRTLSVTSAKRLRTLIESTGQRAEQVSAAAGNV